MKQMLQYWPLLAFPAYLYLVGRAMPPMFATWDEKERLHRIRYGLPDMDHDPMWRFCALILGGIGVVLGALSWWPAAIMLPAAGGAWFATRHRVLYNEKHDAGPYYLSIAPWYDRMWMRSVGLKWKDSSAKHWHAYKTDAAYTAKVDKAGRRAFHFETITGWLLSLVVLGAIVNKSLN